MNECFERSALIIGEDGIEKLNNSAVAVFGVGGVGGYVCEALARGGVGKILICDGDRVAASNINRQLIALSSTIGRPKVEVMRERIININPSAEVDIRSDFLTSDNIDSFNLERFDCIVDAVDDINAKVALAKAAQEKGIKIISAMGAGNKLDPTLFEVSDIYKTSVCPLARAMRQRLKKEGVKKLKVVYSKEPPQKPTKKLENEKTVGSLPFVPSVMGLIIAGEVIKDLCGYNN